MRRDDLFDFANRLEIAGFFTEVSLANWQLPELKVETSVRRVMQKRIGWVPLRACVTAVPKEYRRQKK